MKIDIKPTEKVTVLGLDHRSLENLAWCAATFGINRLFWVRGHLLCTEVFENSFEHEIEHGEFPMSQVCYTECPKYRRILEVEKGTEIPVVDASDMKLYRNLLEAILERKETTEES